jgi:hypothetical protein
MSENLCEKAPKGWYCTREKGHPGPCAAWQGERPVPTQVINYGDKGTIHGSTLLNVEVDLRGNVVAVWFRCMALPFEAHCVGPERASKMNVMSRRVNKDFKLHGVTIQIPV